jgi:cytochrome c-type biogenesis protein CcmF
MEHLGRILVLVSFALTAVTAALAVHGAVSRAARTVRASGWAMRATAWVNGALALLLSHAIVTHDFSNKYVASYSDSGMPLFYLLTAFWGGEKGALLFWVVTLSILAALYARLHRDDGSLRFGWVNAALALSLLFFDVLMVFASSPFERFLASGGPADGNGLNPLLQNPMMAIHPPLQLAGFVAYTVPFAIAIGALIAGESDGRWVRDARRWQLFAWTTLTAGLIIGELWSYVELGWGGYWGWDPVENAALLPWLTGTAFVHSASVEQRRGLFRRWNFVLISLTFFLTIFATFLTRSQLIQSLHSFSNSVLTPFFLYYMAILAILCFALIAWRWTSLRPARRVENAWSREAVVLMNVGLFLMATFVVLWGTLLPKITESGAVRGLLSAVSSGVAGLTGGMPTAFTEAINVGPTWFNQVVGPIGILILGLTAVGPMLPLRTGPNRATRMLLLWTALASLAATAAITAAFLAVRAHDLSFSGGIAPRVALGAYIRHMSWAGPYGFVAIWFGLWTLATLGVDWVRAVRRRRKLGSWRAATSLFRDNPKRFGGHLVHVGVALSFLGFAGEAGKILKKDVILAPMERIVVGSQEVTFLGTAERWVPQEGYAAVRSSFLVRPVAAPLPDAVVKAVADRVPGATVARGDGAELWLTFADVAEAARLRAGIAASTSWARDYRLVRADPERLELKLAPAQLETLSAVPQSLQRRVRSLQALAGEVGDRLAVSTARGEPLLTVRAADAAMFAAIQDGMASTGAPWMAGRIEPGQPDVVRVVPADAGRVMQPEIRFYLKSENPTTEVAIDSGPLADLYLAAAPGQGVESVNLTAMQNPMMASLWLGSLVLLAFGYLLVVPLARSAVRDDCADAEGMAEEGGASPPAGGQP